MSFSFWGLFTSGAVLEAFLLWRLLRFRGLAKYPYFGAFVVGDLIRSLALMLVAPFQSSAMNKVYWRTELPMLFLLLLLVWEAVRNLFPEKCPLRRIALGALFLIACLEFLIVPALSWLQSSEIHFAYRYVPPVFEQYFSLAEATLLLSIAALARYYRIPFGRNMRGMILGLGLFLPLYSTNFAGLELAKSFFPYWHVAMSGLYIALLVFWLWAFWGYFPAPVIIRTPSLPQGDRWDESWAALRAMRGR